jgi:VanZ family protein
MVSVPDVRTRDGRIDVALWVATAACGLLTLVLSLLTVPPGTSAFPGVDKLEHMVAYLVTSTLLFLVALWRPGRGDGPLASWGAWLPVAILAVGGLIELIQSRIGREAELADWLAEVFAVALAYAIVALWRRSAAEHP